MRQMYLVTLSARTTYRNIGVRPVTLVPTTEVVAIAVYGPSRSAFETGAGVVSVGDLVVVPAPEGGEWPATSFRTLRPGDSHEGQIEVVAAVANPPLLPRPGHQLVTPGAQFVEVITVLMAADGSIGPVRSDDLRFTYSRTGPIPVSIPEPRQLRPCSGPSATRDQLSAGAVVATGNQL